MSVASVIQSRSSFWQELNYNKIRFNINFVASNVINIIVDGVSISPVTFTTNHLNTMNLIIAAINNTGIARAVLDTTDIINRTITVYGLSTNMVSVSSVVVTLGTVQAVATITQSRYPALLSMAQSISSGLANCNYEYVTALIIMHWLSLESQSGGTGNAQSGTIVSKREGDLSITYASNSSSNSNNSSYWGQTAYGMEYNNLRRMCIMGARNRMI